MILKRLYSEPEVFKTVNFIIGINYIFGAKAVGPAVEFKDSLNGIGKSAFLDLIDFTLLSTFNKQSSKRLYAAYKSNILSGVFIILDFEVENIKYSIKRSFDEPSTVYFSISGSEFEEYQINNLKPRLCDIIFKRNYEGHYSDKWLRKLLPFYIKIQDPDKEPFINPIKYIQEAKEVELNNYHFFLLDINNKYSYQNLQVQTDYNKIDKTLKEANQLISETYGSKVLSEIDSKLRSLTLETEKLEKSIHLFKLSEKYKIDEEQANNLTGKIKNLWLDNSSDELKVKSYEDSLHLDIKITSNKISRIYSELNDLLGQRIEKTLSQAIDFRKNLVESRREFIFEEIERIKSVISARSIEIDKLENKRAEIFKFLKAKKAIKDLSEAHFELNKRKEEIASLESRVRLVKDLQKEKLQINQRVNELEQLILEFKDSIQQQELDFVRILTSIYNSLYPELDKNTIFDITPNLKSDAKIQFTILPNNEMLSKGRNQGRTLIYDLSVLFHSIEKNIKAPRFLIHDGIFDGVDKTHFIELVKFLEDKKLSGYEFQYLITLNEEGTLSDKFADADLVNPANIENEAILVLSSNSKLFNQDF